MLGGGLGGGGLYGSTAPFTLMYEAYFQCSLILMLHLFLKVPMILRNTNLMIRITLIMKIIHIFYCDSTH